MGRRWGPGFEPRERTQQNFKNLARRMNASDYCELLGIEDGVLDDWDTCQHGVSVASYCAACNRGTGHPRCHVCGDETGICGCAD